MNKKENSNEKHSWKKRKKIAQTESSHKEIAQRDNQKFASKQREIPSKGICPPLQQNRVSVSVHPTGMSIFKAKCKKNSTCV